MLRADARARADAGDEPDLEAAFRRMRELTELAAPPAAEPGEETNDGGEA